MEYNIHTKQGPVATVPIGVYGGIDYHGEVPVDVARAAGWRVVTPAEEAPTGYVVTGRSYVDAGDGEHVNEVLTLGPAAVTITIPAATQAVAEAYKAIMEAAFGDGAATNPELTEAAISVQQVINPTLDALSAMRLKTASDVFAAMCAALGITHTWAYPFGATEIEIANPEAV